MFFVDSRMTPPAINLQGKENADGTYSFDWSSPNSASSVPKDDSSSLPELEQLYRANQDWAVEQAQKQMDYQTSANKIAMDFSAAAADKERAFQTEMSNTAYQRAVEDLRRAGLNPILAYSQGGASVPSVNTASGVTSSGSKASTSDTGYGSYELDFKKLELIVNTAKDIFSSLLNASTGVKVANIKTNK